jgi:hypothetical protein
MNPADTGMIPSLLFNSFDPVDSRYPRELGCVITPDGCRDPAWDDSDAAIAPTSAWGRRSARLTKRLPSAKPLRIAPRAFNAGPPMSAGDLTAAGRPVCLISLTGSLAR